MRIRPSWDTYFLNLAHAVSERGTCDRKRVGAVFVVDSAIVSTGYNGSIRGLPHCDDEGHDMLNGHCVRTVHAEVNAIAQAARLGRSLAGARAYLTTYPCWPCFKAMANSGIKSVVFSEAYRPDPRVAESAGALGIAIISPVG